MGRRCRLGGERWHRCACCNLNKIVADCVRDQSSARLVFAPGLGNGDPLKLALAPQVHRCFKMDKLFELLRQAHHAAVPRGALCLAFGSMLIYPQRRAERGREPCH
jgi:hypothetical protein